MAKNDVRIRVGANGSQAVGVLGQVQGALTRMDAAGAAAAAALGSVGIILAKGIREYNDYSTAIAEVNTLLGDNANIGKLSEDVRALTREFGGNAPEQAKALYQIISSGAAEAGRETELLNASNRLAIGGVTEIATAADGLTSILNAYGAEAGTASEVSDKLFTAMKAGKTTIGELSENIGGVAPLAATTNVSLSELLAGVSALTKGGVATSQAMTQVQSIIAAVVKPSAKATKAAAELGLQFDVAGLKSKGLAGFLEEVKNKAGGNEAVLAQLFGRIEGLQGVLALTGAQAESFATIMDDMATSTGSTEAAVRKMSDTPAFKQRQLQSALADLRLTLGELSTAITPVIEAVADGVNAFNDLPGPVRESIVAIAALGGAVKVLKVVFATLLPIQAATAAGMGATAAGATAAASANTAAAAATRALAVAMRAVPLVAAAAGVLFLVDKITDLVAANESLAESQRQARADIEAGLMAARTQAAETLRAGTTVEATLAAITGGVEKLSGAQLAFYTDNLNQAERYLAAQIVIGTREHQLHGQTEVNLKRTGALLRAVRVEQEKLGTAVVAGSEAAVASQADLAAQLETTRAGLKALGLDADGVLTGIDSKARVAIDQFVALSTQAGQSGAVIRAAFGKVLSNLDTEAELNALLAHLRELQKQGTDTAEAIGKTETKLAEIRRAADTDLGAVEQAFKDVGLVADTELQRMAAAAAATYETIKASGQASAQQQAAAFSAMAQAQLAGAAAVSLAEEKRIASQLRSLKLTTAEREALEALLAARLAAAQAAVDAALVTEQSNHRSVESARANTKAVKETGAAATSAGGQQAAAAEQSGNAWSELANKVKAAAHGISNAVGAIVTAQLQAGTTMSAWLRAASDRNLDALRTRFLSAEKGVAALTDRINDGRTSLRELDSLSRRTAAHFGLLDEEHLTGLRSAISDAQRRMLDLRDASRDTLTGLQDEFDQLNDNFIAIERRRAEQREADIAAKLADAQAAGDTQAIRDLQKSLHLLRQITAARLKDAQARQAETGDRGTLAPVVQSTPANTTVAPRSASNAPAGAEQLHILRFEGAGQSANVFSTEDAAARVLEILRDAGAVITVQ